ncbi:alpha/beta hydrolase [Microbacterium sp. RG1]|uniref:alpha/beta hydrolase n=1 Tax=Microbacterium sp. RG1 TaxID=2489212 RepID=UPI0010CA5EAA|nr:alpha/beta hydrolase-fold protein [Microbacterium sp. RG1]QCQ15997.1 esterase [Microbacterium sp. RG1]
MTALLEIRIVSPVLIGVFCAVSLVALGYLLWRPGRGRWLLHAAVAFGLGAVLALVVSVLADATGMFGITLPWQVKTWASAGLGATAVAVANLWDSRWRRRVIALISAVVFLLTTTLGINAHFGLNATLANFLHIQIDKPIVIPTASPGAWDPDVPLSQSWQPPSDMPASGKQGTVSIPATKSGFAARQAGLYIPPAGLTANPPLLPLVILMMGQPGDPDPQYIAATLDAAAAKNKGLAPYVLVVDQLGDPTRDPACADSPMYGNVETYVTQDVVDFARTLPVIPRAQDWIIAGYSNGGGCAFTYAAKHPDIWGNLLSISGEIVPGSEHPDETIADVYGGSEAAYKASQPMSILASGAVAYPNEWALFTAGENDPGYVAQAQTGAAAAAAAGWDAQSYIVPGAGHVVDALEGGLAEGFARLYPRLGLAPS